MIFNRDFYNSEYYADPTAAAAMENVMREERLKNQVKRGDGLIHGTKVSGSRNERDPEWDGLEELGIAIITQAAEEYRKCLRRLKPGLGKKKAAVSTEKKLRDRIQELEEFFLSDWFGQLTRVDGEMILERLRKETEE